MKSRQSLMDAVFLLTGYGRVDFRRPRDPDHRSYLTLMAQPHLSNRLGELDHAAKAWAGLIAYRLMGRTTSLLPGPQEEVAPLAD